MHVKTNTSSLLGAETTSTTDSADTINAMSTKSLEQQDASSTKPEDSSFFEETSPITANTDSINAMSTESVSYDTLPMSVKTRTNSLLAAETSAITANTDSINAMSTESSEHIDASTIIPEVPTTIEPSKISNTKATNTLQSSSSTSISLRSATIRNEATNLETSVSIDIATSTEPVTTSAVPVTTIKPGNISKLNVYYRRLVLHNDDSDVNDNINHVYDKDDD